MVDREVNKYCTRETEFNELLLRLKRKNLYKKLKVLINTNVQ